MDKYKGWTNRTTWKASLYCTSREDVEALKEHLEEALESLPLPIADFLQDEYDAIDWEELLEKFPE